MKLVQFSQPDNWGELAGWQVLILNETGSTNDDSLQLADELPGEFVVWAAHQTAGRGREDRSWHDQPGSALIFSVLMRLKTDEASCLGRFSALGALSLIDLLKSEYDLKAKVKWPNDVFLNGKKVSGILCEIHWKGAKPEAMVLGVGINLTDHAFKSVGDLRSPATSLEAEGVLVSKPEVFLEKLLKAIQQRRRMLGSDQFLSDWNENLAYKGQFVQFIQYQGKTGLFCPEYVNPDGSLTVSNQEGEKIVLYSSEISSASSSEEP